MWMKQVIEITQTKIFIAENVKGLVNLSNVKDIIQSDFSSTGDNGYLGVTLSGRAIRYKSSLVPRCGLSTSIPNAA